MSEETKRCPYCGEEILAVAIKCKHCGSMLTDTLEQTTDSATFIKNALASRFEIKEDIGRGGMSVVYKAVQKSLNRVVALKILPQQFTHDSEFLERFHREAQTAAKLDHPSIVTIFDEGAENGVHYIAMKYIAGENLHTRIQRQDALSVEEMKQIVLPIADGLGYAHEAGMVHRDIKSANILIDKKGRAVLTDFGIARATESKHLTQTGTVLGTPEYMSPEQAQGEKTDARSDIYSLGVVIYECLTGRLPFQSDNMLGTIHKITHEAPTAPGLIRLDIPEQVENVVLRCLAKEAADRYLSCSELAEALEKGESRCIVEKEPVVAQEPEKPKPVPAKKTTALGAAMPGWWKAAMGFVSVLLVIVVVLLIWQLSHKPSMPGVRKAEVIANVLQDTTLPALPAPEEAEVAIDTTDTPAPPAPEEAKVAINVLTDTAFVAPPLAAEEEKVDNFLRRQGIEFVYVRGGTFQMGDLWGEGHGDERPVHRVTVSDFYISKYEITFTQYDKFCDATGRSKPSDEGWGRGRRPVINVGWNDAAAFCKWLSQKTGITIRLPTEAEWEYAARERGKNVLFGNGRDIADPSEINFDGNSDYKKSYSVTGVYRRKTIPVGSFGPNSLGLYDMSGNVWEWCADWYNNYYYRNSRRNNPKGPSSGAGRVVRGGSWISEPRDCRTTNRLRSDPDDGGSLVGFRVARSVQ